MDKKSGASITLYGSASLLAIFAVLCIVVFAMLSLSTAQAYDRLADASADAVTEYYLADFDAEKIFAELRGGKQPDGVEKNDNNYRYSCFISETQRLEVELLLKNGNWQVLRWQAVSVADHQPDESITVWSGQIAS